jgi:hypothetical protein
LSRSYGERASSPQAAYHSLLPVGKSSLAPLWLLSPQSHQALWGDPCWEHVAGMGAGSLFGENGNGAQTEERMIENPYKRLPPLERKPDGTPYRMTPAQRKQASALIRRECCNCEDGNCIVLDDGDTCACPQMVSLSVCCKWFRWAVLPLAGTLEAEIYRDKDLKRCAVCGGQSCPGKTDGRTSTGVFTCTIPSVRWWNCSTVGGRKPSTPCGSYSMRS